MAVKASPRSIEFEPYATLADLTDAVAELNAAGVPDESVVRFAGTVDFHRHGARVVRLTIIPPDTKDTDTESDT